MASVETGLQVSGVAIAFNIMLAVGKVVTGIVGNSYALVADGIESTADVVTSLVVWSSLRISAKPPDENHPYGHGKAESLAGVVVSMSILGAALLIAYQSIQEIRAPHGAPAWYTLVVLAGVILIKETLFRYVITAGNALASTSLISDAWHHRSDALTSLAAFIGITIALLGGEGYESADDWAALIACTIIFYNGVRLLRPALDEVMDAAVDPAVEENVRSIAMQIDGAARVGECRIRKSGLGLFVDIHILVDGDISVRRGHSIAHDVEDALCNSTLNIHDVMVHVEPMEEYP